MESSILCHRDTLAIIQQRVSEHKGAWFWINFSHGGKCSRCDERAIYQVMFWK